MPVCQASLCVWPIHADDPQLNILYNDGKMQHILRRIYRRDLCEIFEQHQSIPRGIDSIPIKERRHPIYRKSDNTRTLLSALM